MNNDSFSRMEFKAFKLMRDKEYIEAPQIWIKLLETRRQDLTTEKECKKMIWITKLAMNTLERLKES
jgi:transposase-like protein